MALAIATMFSARVVFLYLLRGADAFERRGASVPTLLGLYFGSAAVIGPLVGVLLPVARASASGAALVGLIAAVPLFAMTRIAADGLASWALEDLLGVLLLAVLLGPAVGVTYRRTFRDGL